MMAIGQDVACMSVSELGRGVNAHLGWGFDCRNASACVKWYSILMKIRHENDGLDL